MSQEWMDQIKNTSKACNFFKGLVVSSAQIQQNFMEKYNISVAEFLRPFVQSRQVKMKLAMREKNYPDFNVTLYDREEYNAISKEHLNETLRSVLKEVVPDQNVSITKQWKSRSSVDSMIEANPTQWFHANQSTIGDFSSFNFNLNFLDQPIMILYVVSGSENDVMRAIHQVKLETEKLIKCIFQFNPQDIDSIKKVILVLNDAANPLQFYQEDKIRKEFNNHFCKIFSYNLPNAIPLQVWNKNLRKRYILPPKYPQGTLTLLDEHNFKVYKNYFDDLMHHQVILNIERNYNILTSQFVEARKRPLTDAFFQLLRRTDVPRIEQDYSITSRECLMRYLADLSFMLSDYENAAEYYRAYIQELKNNKTKTTMVQLNAQEYLIYSRLLMDPQLRSSKKDRDEIFQLFDEVQKGYQEEKQIAFILRLIYFYIYTTNYFGRHLKESILYLQKSNKFLRDQGQLIKPDSYAMFQIMTFEQIAFYHLRLEPAQFRKFAHNLTLVGSRYEAEGFKLHSLRCYKIVESIYRNCQWTGILYWVEGHLGANYIELGQISDGIDQYKHAFNLVFERQNLELHSQLVVDWKKAYTALEKANKMTSVTRIQLLQPVVKGIVDIVSDDDMLQLFDNPFVPELPSIQTGTKRTQEKQQWSSLSGKGWKEEQLIKSMDTEYIEEKVKCWNKIPCILKNDLYDKIKDFGRTMYAEDNIYLRIVMYCPLKVPCQITNLKVEYEFYTEQSDDLLQLDSSAVSYQKTTIPSSETVEFSFTRPSQHSLTVGLKPHKPGYLIITGFSWSFMDIPTNYIINYDDKNQTKRKSVNFFNKFQVLPSVPVLSISLKSAIDSEIYYGEIKVIRLIFTNQGETPIKNIKLCSLVTYHFGFDSIEIGTIEPKSFKEQVIYLRCSFMENFTGKILIKYGEPGVYRYKRLVFPMKVKSSFKLSLSCDRSLEYWKFTLGAQDYFIEHMKGKLMINQVLCINKNWKAYDDSYLSESSQEQYLMATFKLQKLLGGIGSISQEAFKKKVNNFWEDESDCTAVGIQGEIQMDKNVLQKFINEDIKYYFDQFYHNDYKDRVFEFPLFLVSVWRFADDEGKIIEGMHELPVNPQNYTLQKGLEMPISIIINSEPRIAYKEPLTVLKVQIKVSNSKFGVPIHVRLEFVNGDEAMRSYTDTNDPAFIWQGSQKVEIDNLKPQEQLLLEQEIGFIQKGIYDICRVRVRIESDWMKIEQKDYFSNEYETILVDVY